MSETTEIIPIKARLEGLRGGAYFDVWADYWKSEEAKPIKMAIDEHVQQTGRLTPVELVIICDRFDHPWKTLVEQLEKEGRIPTGTYDKLPALAKIRKRAKERSGEQ